jgi:hypothetical protein
MITKTDSCKIEHQPNDRIFIWNYNNLIKKPDINYEYKFKINKILRIKIKKIIKKLEMGFKKTERKANSFTVHMF